MLRQVTAALLLCWMCGCATSVVPAHKTELSVGDLDGAQASVTRVDGRSLGGIFAEAAGPGLMLTYTLEGMRPGWYSVQLFPEADCKVALSSVRGGVGSAKSPKLAPKPSGWAALPNLYAHADEGRAVGQFMTDRITLNGQSRKGMRLLDSDGTAVLITADEELFYSDADQVLACGEFRPTYVTGPVID